MVERLDVRGLSCPSPVLLVNRMMRRLGSGTFEVIGDLPAARDNIHRLARDKGWSVKERTKGEVFLLRLSK